MTVVAPRSRSKAQVKPSPLASMFAAVERPVRVLVAAHSHPELSKGGAEIAAFQLFKALDSHADFEAWFLGCARDTKHQKLGATFSQPFSEREYLYAGGAYDWFKFANQDPKFPREFRQLLDKLSPDIVHFHHYLNFGVEAFLHVREALPNCRIVVTLHEYLALCHHFGQMITTKSRTLCYGASPLRCSSCFPEVEPSDFFLRFRYIKRFFDVVDHFIAPSRFLAERYIAWGIPKERMSVIENVIAARPSAPPVAKPRKPNELLRVGFFGQISLLKGINVIFDAADAMLERKIDHIVFEIYGDHTGQPVAFQEDFLQRLAKAGRNVKFQGAYDPVRVDRLMQSVDLVLVPSIWWENSPVVIQEALRNRRAVVCSDIGGMAEKVRDGIDGFHFPVGNPLALAALLVKLAESPNVLMNVERSLQPPAPADEVTALHLQCYQSLVKA